MKKIVIIGAGPAGLTAGAELLKDNNGEFEVTILEESDVFGGISRTVRYNGNRMDIGGHRFFSKDKNVTAFWEKIMPTQGSPSFDDKILGREKNLVAGGPDPETEDRVMLIRRRVSRIYYLNKFFDYPISMKPQTFINMGLPRTVKAGFSYLKSTVSKKEETSLAYRAGLISYEQSKINAKYTYDVAILEGQQAEFVYQSALKDAEDKLQRAKDEVTETEKKIEEILVTFTETDDFGEILRAKGMVEDVNGSWIYFDMVPGEYELREGEPDYTGRLCVIGVGIDEHRLEELFGLV